MQFTDNAILSRRLELDATERVLLRSVKARDCLASDERLVAATFFAAAMMPLAIVIHLCAETASVGLHEILATLVIRHAYLLSAGVGACVAALISAGTFLTPSLRRRRLRVLLSALPVGSGAVGFGGVSCLTQLALFCGSQAIEGAPVLHGNFVVGVAVALLACILAGFSLATLPFRVLVALGAIYMPREDIRTQLHRRAVRHVDRHARAALFFTYRAVIGSRPPPLRRA